MRFSDVQHQDRALSVLRRALRSGRTHHAYLFEGPEGVGKELTGQTLAARLLCEDEGLAPDADACGACRACRLLAASNHPDFHLIHRGLHKLHPDRNIRVSKGLFLVVDVIRRFLIEPASSTPNLGRRHVFLIRDAERMNEEAQNALLKTLEEPPGATCLILVTASADRLQPTIRSRCQRISFDLLPAAFVQARLSEQLDVEAPAAQTLARLAGGRLGAALRWHRLGLLDTLDEVGGWLDRLTEDQPEAFARGLVDLATDLATRNAAPEEAEEATDTADAEETEDGGASARTSAKTVPTDELRDALKLVLMLVAAVYRDALVCCCAEGAGDLPLHVPQQHERTAALARVATPESLEACVRAVAHAERMLDQNVAPQLATERLAIALTGVAPVP